MPVEYTAVDAVAERFWPKVEQSTIDECWPWRAAIDRRGYGVFAARKTPDAPRTTNHFAHRVAYILAYGQIPVGLSICHRCDNPPCCNPAHLFLGTLKENTHDMWRKGRHPAIPKAFKPGDQAGEKNTRAKMTPAQVLEIRSAAASGIATRFLAAQYGLATSAIRKIVARKTWPNI